MSQSQERTSDRSPVTRDSPGNPGLPEVEISLPTTAPAKRTSLTIPQLAELGASNNSTPVFQQHAAHTLRTELGADAVLIIDYTDAFGARTVRATSGTDKAIVGSEIWLPDWLTPVDVDIPVILIDINPARLSAVTAFAPETRYRSALAIAVPGITGASGMIVALAERGIDFDDSQVEAARTVASLISMSASRSAALSTVQRDEAQITGAISIIRTVSNSPADHSTMLEKIAGLLAQFFEFDMIAHRVRVDGEFVTRGQRADHQDQSYAMTDPAIESVESRAATLGTAVSNTTLDAENASRSHRYPAFESAAIASVLAIPVNRSATQVLVLGSARNGAFKTEAVATANRLVPALTAAFASDSAALDTEGRSDQARSDSPGYLESIASATELMSACGVVATQVKNHTGASSVRLGFIDEETGRSKLEFDTEPSEDILDFTWVNPDEIEHLAAVNSGTHGNADGTADPAALYSRVRVPLKIPDRVIGFVEATADDGGFGEADVAEIRRIAAVCAPVLANLRQLEQSKNTLKKLETLNRVCDQIRLDDPGDPIRSPRIASLIRNLFDADWLYFGTIDHANDHSTTEITDGLEVPELAPGVRVSRRSLLTPSTTAFTSPEIVDLDSVATGQRASGRWMFRAGLRSALCAPLRLNGIVAAMVICASRKPTAFGSLEKKLATRIVTELENSIEKTSTVPVAGDDNADTAQFSADRLGPNLQAVLNNTSVIVLTIDSNGIVTKVAGRGIERLELVPERLLGRDFVKYSRKIDGL
ncbi:MAG: GAF domain-containing protein, partial [Chloroflexi bacterium]|nr:GAF domain-containing protein [Chloroflexota bacterium]